MEDGYISFLNYNGKLNEMTEEQLEIQRLKKENKELYEILEDLEELLAGFTNRGVDCYKCTCGAASECNCFHLGLKREHIGKMDNDPSRLAFETLLKGLNIFKGHVTHKAVADVFGYKYVSPKEALANSF